VAASASEWILNRTSARPFDRLMTPICWSPPIGPLCSRVHRQTQFFGQHAPGRTRGNSACLMQRLYLILFLRIGSYSYCQIAHSLHRQFFGLRITIAEYLSSPDRCRACASR